jgi:streptogrisin C
MSRWWPFAGFSFSWRLTWESDERLSMRWIIPLVLLAFATAAGAETAETRGQALAQDAAKYASQFGVPQAEALRRLKAQQESVAATDAVAREFADRLAGISIEHSPGYRIVVLLTGTEPVADRSAAGVPIVFRTGARATHADAVAAMRRHLIDLRDALPGARGAGYDQRTGEVVLLVRPADAARFGLDAIRARAEALSGVPVRVVADALIQSNMTVDGGGRVEGVNLLTGRRNRCTTAFVVTNGQVNAITTAAHCPDQLTYVEADGSSVTLPMIGSWGAAYRDVQINGTADSPDPLFYSDRAAGSLRQVETWRSVASTRAGDFVCHYGESSGYSCATVELTDYAPPGDLCGGPCSPTWVTVQGPSCVPGDSGGPVFSGDVAFGIAKGINRDDAGRCEFYYYMSTDYLPPPWRLLTAGDVSGRRAGPPAADR